MIKEYIKLQALRKKNDLNLTIFDTKFIEAFGFNRNWTYLPTFKTKKLTNSKKINVTVSNFILRI